MDVGIDRAGIGRQIPENGTAGPDSLSDSSLDSLVGQLQDRSSLTIGGKQFKFELTSFLVSLKNLEEGKLDETEIDTQLEKCSFFRFSSLVAAIEAKGRRLALERKFKELHADLSQQAEGKIFDERVRQFKSGLRTTVGQITQLSIEGIVLQSAEIRELKEQFDKAICEEKFTLSLFDLIADRGTHLMSLARRRQRVWGSPDLSV